MKIEPGTVVGSIPCRSCGAEIPLKVNSKGGLSGVCTAIVRPDAPGHGNNKYCWERYTASRHVVAEIMDEYLKTKGTEGNVEGVEDRKDHGSEPAGTEATVVVTAGDEEPVGEFETGHDEPARAGTFAGKLRHFLVGDE